MTSRPPRALASGLLVTRSIFLQPFKSNFIPDPEGTISFALSPLLRDLFECSFSPSVRYIAYTLLGDSADWGLLTTSSVPLASISKKWARAAPETHHMGVISVANEFAYASRIPAHVGLLIMRTPAIDYAPAKTTLSFLPFSLIVVVHVVLPSV